MAQLVTVTVLYLSHLLNLHLQLTLAVPGRYRSHLEAPEHTALQAQTLLQLREDIYIVYQPPLISKPSTHPPHQVFLGWGSRLCHPAAGTWWDGVANGEPGPSLSHPIPAGSGKVRGRMGKIQGKQEFTEKTYNATGTNAKRKNIPNKTCPIPPSSLVGATLSQSPGQGPAQGSSPPAPCALRQLPGGRSHTCELSQLVAMLQLVKSPWSFLSPKQKKGFPSRAGATGGGGGGGSTTVCQAENPTVHVFISLLPTTVLHCR